ncbi:MAG: rod shape-determining protein MreD [Clostridia bacterium]|nr:rod shape-determining protein MreD [Clostridia bacterium]
MTKKSERIFAQGVNFLLFLILAFAHNTGFHPFSIATANPFAVFALLIAFSMFATEWSSCFAGIFLGIFMDSGSANGSIFYTVLFFISALFVTVASRYIFNNNLRAAIVMCLICSLLLFGTRWLIFYGLHLGAAESITFLFKSALPSAVYTTVFIVPFYYFEKAIFQILDYQ